MALLPGLTGIIKSGKFDNKTFRAKITMGKSYPEPTKVRRKELLSIRTLLAN
jgi:hypothetical protein